MTTINRLKELMSAATPGPWQLQDGCSWRRIGTAGHDGNVLCPDTYSRTDRHPDLTAGKGEDLYANLRLIVEAVNALPDLLATIARLESENVELRQSLAINVDAQLGAEARALAAEKRLSEAQNGEEMPEVAAIRYLNDLRSPCGAVISILCDDEEAWTRDKQMAIEVCSDWTQWEPLRVYGESILQCSANAVVLRDTFLKEPNNANG